MSESQDIGYHCFHESDWDYFKDSIGDFDKQWEEVTNNLGSDFLSYLQSFLFENQYFFSEDCTFQVELIIDTNIVFGEIRAILKGKPSFLMSIIGNPFLKLYAPPEIVEETISTIENDLPRNLNQIKAKEVAMNILSQIEILRGQRLESWIHAYHLIGERDKKDVPFLSLAFSLESHGIMTRDKDFEDQTDVRIWKLGEAGRMVSDFSKGSFSFFILGNFIPRLIQFCYWLCVSFLKFVADVVKGFISVITALIKGGADALSRIPKWILFSALGLVAITLICSEKARERIGNFMKDIGKIALFAFNEIKKLFKRVIEGIRQMIQLLMPFISVVINAVGYLFYHVQRLINRIHELEESRAEL